ncbi:MAG: HAD-IB family phosphatase [Myxococcota bacterium]
MLAGFSAGAFVKDRFAEERPGLLEMARTAAGALRFGAGQTSFPSFLEETSIGLRGKTEAELMEEGERIFTRHLAADVYPESRALVAAHRSRGHTVVIVSSATRFQVEALANDLGIEHVLCTDLEFDEAGRFTGRVRRPAVWQEGKAVAATTAREHDVDLAERLLLHRQPRRPLPARRGRPSSARESRPGARAGRGPAWLARLPVPESRPAGCPRRSRG